MTPDLKQKKRKSRWSSGIISKPKKKKAQEKADEAGKLDSTMELESAKNSPSKSPVQSASDVKLFLRLCIIFSHKLRLRRRLKSCKTQETWWTVCWHLLKATPERWWSYQTRKIWLEFWRKWWNQLMAYHMRSCWTFTLFSARLLFPLLKSLTSLCYTR